jgi:RING-box protein 1
MADVEMTDAGAAPKIKSAKAGASGDAGDGKKKFEVKKVGSPGYEAHSCMNFS